MRIVLIRGLVLCCCWYGLFGRDAYATELADTLVIDLPLTEQRRLEHLACERKHGVSVDRIQAHRYRDEPERSEFAWVFCKPHGSHDGKPLRYVVSCEREKRDWRCGESDLEVLFAIGKIDVAFSFGGLDFDWAYGSVLKLVKEGWFPSAPESASPRRCTVRKDVIPEWFSVNCLGREITISSWCPQDDCPSIVSSRTAPGF